MKPLYLTLALLLCSCFTQAQIVSLPHGAKITVDTLTTELTVISPGVVEVTKYIGCRPGTSTPNLQLGDSALPDSLIRTEGGGKLKIDTGRFYAAVNAKDGNVSFWDYDGNLLLAEQHRSASLTPSGKKDRYDVRQDFQIGKSQADSIYCGTLPPAKRKNLKGSRVAFGDKAAGLPQRLHRQGLLHTLEHPRKWRTHRRHPRPSGQKARRRHLLLHPHHGNTILLSPPIDKSVQ